MGKTEGARTGQGVLADYETCVQHRPERIHGVVPAGAATRLYQSHRKRVAGIAGCGFCKIGVCTEIVTGFELTPPIEMTTGTAFPEGALAGT